jgi:hypothetical protein
MGGGLMQLVAYGAQDIYLTGNPQITFFKVVYRRHTNFSMESIQQTFSGTADFGGDVVATISRNGDLLYRMYLEHNAKFIGHRGSGSSDELGVVSNYGSNLMKKMEIEIGGQLIDRHYGHFHAAYNELTEFNPTGYHTTLYNRMSGNGIGHATGSGDGGDHASLANSAGWTTVNATSGSAPANQPKMEGKFWIPFHFWFCRNPGLALPLISLQYHEVKVKVEFEKIGNIMGEDTGGVWDTGGTTHTGDSDNNNGSTFDLWCDYIYLDTDERRRFAQVSHEYLIEQVQHQSISETGAFTKNLYFNHPIKELIWKNEHHPFFTPGDSNDLHGGTNTEDSVQFLRAPFSLNGDFELKLNGHDRFKKRDYRYFTRTQVWQHHTGYGGFIGQTQSAENGRGKESQDTIAVYSFALKPEEHQPSGTCNFSRIDNAQLIRSGTSLSILYGGVNIYAVNYNVLRIMSGMGGLAYSN